MVHRLPPIRAHHQAAPKGTVAQVKIGEQTIPANTPNFASVLGQAITAHGYPAAADTSKINYPMTVLLLSILVIFVTLVYAPIAAWLVELFPTRIRYSGLSLPYHIGNGWFGGFLPRDRVRHRGSDRQHLLRSLVPDRDRMHESRRRLLLPAGDEGRRHHKILSGGRGGRDPLPASHPEPADVDASRVSESEAPANLRCRGFFMSRIAGGLGGTRHWRDI